MDEQKQREQRAHNRAKSKLQQTGDGRWFVPSQSATQELRRFYEVKPDPVNRIAVSLTLRSGAYLQHLYAVTFVIRVIQFQPRDPD